MDEKKFYNDLWNLKKEPNLKKERDLFHKITDFFFDPYKNDRIEVAADFLEPGKKILDLGIWGGTFLDLEKVKNKFDFRYGIDISVNSVDQAKRFGIIAQEWNLNNIPYPFSNNYFDAITILAVLEHLFDPYSIIKEINRLLKINGQLIIALPNVASLTNRTRIIFGKLPITSDDPGWDGGHLHYFTINETKKLLTQNGFSIKKVNITGAGQKIKMIYPSLLGGEFVICAQKVK